MAVLEIAGAVLGLAKGFVNAIGAEEVRVAKFNELDRKRTELRQVYNQNVAHAKESVADRNAYIQTEITQTAAAQETARKQAGQSIAAQALIANAEIAELQVQAGQQEGSAIQAAATSGFRGNADLSGTIGAAARATRSAGARALRQAQLQAKANIMQSYNTALNNYTNAEYQKALYAQQQTQNERELARTLKELDLEYKQKDEAYERDQETMQSTKYKILNYLGIGLDLASTGIDTRSTVYKAAREAGWMRANSTT